MTAIVPKLVVDGADGAISFYQRALGAELTERYVSSDGTVVFAKLTIGDTMFELKDADATDRSATALGGSSVIFTIQSSDADAAAAAFIDAGATVIFAVNDMPYGYRQGRVEDPFGYQWIVSQPTEDLPPEEVQRRLEAAGM